MRRYILMEKMLEFQVGLIEFFIEVIMKIIWNKLIMIVLLIWLDQIIGLYILNSYAKMNI